ncbi:MAG: PIG-L family deacetylase, partial [Pyrinomonadaceae bacterium]|nr:PIG-L family deacetylase [Pyrinomonadaceae bacterium]
VHEGDEIWRDLAVELKQVIDKSRVDAIFAPQGIGNHVDHLQTIRAVLSCNFQQPIFWYKDAPYTIRNPNAKHSDLLPKSLIEQKVDIAETLEQKINACCAYVSQNGFQFGGNEKLAETLREYNAQNDGESFLSVTLFEI